MAEKHAAAPLEDIMVAMDVVDNLRHQQTLVDRELDGEARRERLLERLRTMYAAQGIDVPDHVLQEGIAALEEERFKYEPVPSSWRTKVAHIWISRGRWGKPVGFLAVVGAVFYSVYFVTDVLPERKMLVGLPTQIDRVVTEINQTAKDAAVAADAETLANNALRAIDSGNTEIAQSILANLQDLEANLKRSYDIRVVARPNQNSGIWRRPPNNSTGRNYYLIVEAIGADKQPVELLIFNQENNQAKRTKIWGLRVDEATFMAVAADKKDDGIIQNNIVGRKPVGVLEPEYRIATSGATITEW